MSSYVSGTIATGTIATFTNVGTSSTATNASIGNGDWVWVTVQGHTTPTTIPNQQPSIVKYVDRFVVPEIIDLKIGQSKAINFPDGTSIYFKADGSFVIDDANSKVTYKANNIRNFNPFINASDKLEDFIRYCGDVGVRQGDMLGIPIKHFVQWLVIEAARADGESTSEVLALSSYSQPRCRTCRRFISPKLKANGIEFCRPRCLEIKLQDLDGPMSDRRSP